MTDSGWVYVVIVLKWYTKKIVGHYSGKQARTAEWLEALEKGLNREFPGGVRENGLKLIRFHFLNLSNQVQTIGGALSVHSHDLPVLLRSNPYKFLQTLYLSNQDNV